MKIYPYFTFFVTLLYFRVVDVRCHKKPKPKALDRSRSIWIRGSAPPPQTVVSQPYRSH
jgi:hypothetical protein